MVGLVLLCLWVVPLGAEPSGTITWGVHVTLATRWLDPGETDAEITPFLVMYALHDALVKPMPAGLNTPSLAESWSMSKDGRTWEFELHQIQRILSDRVIFAPIWENGFIRAYGPRVEEAGLTLITAFPYSGPLEDVRLKK
ncbi:MAG: hypothetical protein AUH78_16135 [Gemmatimonadetes bacterium 13_1_40CM_4_69_8]|nr:MAG: hypothetical protein AUH78_16135 [Gemmatimonadetes bacterium 13_1_40CM_4_69_8]